MLRSLHLNQILSFRDLKLELKPLNVLIGPNASGKSNLLEIVSLMQSLPTGLSEYIRASGGARDWIWKGAPAETGQRDVASIEAILDNPSPQPAGAMPLRYLLKFGPSGQHHNVVEERLENEKPYQEWQNRPYYHFEVKSGFGRLSIVKESGPAESVDSESAEESSQITPDNTEPGQSILSERRDPNLYPVATSVARFFQQLRMYREWNIGRRSEVRSAQLTDGPSIVLEEDFSNLALVINRIQEGETRKALDSHLAKFYELYERIHPRVEAGRIQLTLVERGIGSSIPATRLSDGTIRFIALLAILRNPSPPPLLCIEEPELALHPDIIPLVAELLRDASQRTQLIVTTHSRDLINEFTDEPEAVVVCERDFDSATQMRRLSKPDLEEWLDRYTLGQLWEKGEIGGTRW